MHGHVPEKGEYFAARAGDSPYPPGALLTAGAALPRPVPAWYHPTVPAERPIPFDYSVIYADRDLIVADKPHFLPTTTNGRLQRETLQTRLRVDFGEDDIVPLHRLDRLTAGLVLCSRNPATRAAYQRIFGEGSAVKRYQGVVKRPLYVDREITLRMHKPHGSRQVLVASDGTLTSTYVRAAGREVTMWPRTGHTHQLRVLLNHLGHPLLGDDTYPTPGALDLYDFRAPLALLHEAISFIDPLSHSERQFFSSQHLRTTIE
ncbi:pseudouridine synthase [Corynebacterium yonathiae]|uniref:RNA pseudouridylate synthase n=1 Tax=Corynebacterium yonathiae TaxID=2913504 RepID=A0ABU8Y2L2_9CORY|nr:pseudouridine synthase [uncultured Corynebacterium sp.]